MSEIESESHEEWRDVVGYEGLYSVSNLGRVRRDAPGINTFPGRLLKKSPHSKGYDVVNLTKDKKACAYTVHSLVAYAFLGPRPNGMEIAHENGIKTDNRLENIRYATHSENQLDNHKQGKRIGKQKLSLQTVSDIRYLLKAGYDPKDLAFAFGCSVRHINQIKNGEKWSHCLDQTLLNDEE